jgi:D-glycero-D-manno-heptose 1,7-bisphosphate phosphatase
MPEARPALLLDRDGTLIEDDGYISQPENVRMVPGSIAALKVLQHSGLALVITSNQSGIGRGLITRAQARAVHERVVEILEAGGVHLDGAYYCPHAPQEGCECRKPRPGLLQEAAAELHLDLSRCIVVGDQARDVEAGRRAGCRTAAIVRGAEPGIEADLVADNWVSLAGSLRVLASCES